MYKKYTIEYAVMCHVSLIEVMVEIPWLELSSFRRINASPQ